MGVAPHDNKHQRRDEYCVGFLYYAGFQCEFNSVPWATKDFLSLTNSGYSLCNQCYVKKIKPLFSFLVGTVNPLDRAFVILIGISVSLLTILIPMAVIICITVCILTIRFKKSRKARDAKKDPYILFYHTQSCGGYKRRSEHEQKPGIWNSR